MKKSVALASVFLFFGIVSLFAASFLTINRFSALSHAFSPIQQSTEHNPEFTPVEITIPSLSLTLPVFSATVSGNRWETTDRGVSFLASSSLPGEGGNSVFYGHNWPRILGEIKEVKIGDAIVVTLSNGVRGEYRVVGTATVTSDQAHVVGQTVDARITIFTCAGFLDTRRFVVTGELKELHAS